MNRFEYAVVEAKVFGGFEIEYPDRQEKVKGELAGIINRLGAEGWELAAVTDDQMGGPQKLIFKRSNAF